MFEPIDFEVYQPLSTDQPATRAAVRRRDVDVVAADLIDLARLASP